MKYLAISTVLSALSAAQALSPAGGPNTPLNVTAQNYTDVEGTILQGFLSLPSKVQQGEKVPAVIILHDASGPDTYEQQRASIFASQYNYVGFAADIFGLLIEKPPANATWFERGDFMAQFDNATLVVQRIQAAVEYVQSLEEVDESKVGIVGYCMGGSGVIHYLNHHNELGLEEDKMVKGVISVHPSLSTGGPGEGTGPTGPVSIPSLFLTGGSDFLTGPEAMEKLEADMKGASDITGTRWESIRYANILHAFSNWFSEGNYDARADARSWHSMMTFLNEEFGFSNYQEESPPPGPDANMMVVDYTDGQGGGLKGHVSMPPEDDLEEGTKLPVVIILPDQNMPSEYEQQRATEITTDTGYITFVADVVGQDHTDQAKYLSRIQAAVDHVKSMKYVHPNKIAVIGFGFGGSGALYYGVWVDIDSSVKAVASFHAEMEEVANFTASQGVTAVYSGDVSAWGGATGGGDGASWGSSGSSEGGASWGSSESSEGGASWVSSESSEGGASWGSSESSEGGASWGSSESSEGGASYSTGSSEGGSSSWGSSGSSEGSTADWGGAESGGHAGEDHAGNSEGGTDGTRQLQWSTVSNIVKPQILIQSGAEDDDMSDVIIFEKVLIALGANYELTRFSDAQENFTVWNDVESRYDARATMRSMDQLYTMLEEVFGDETNEDNVVEPTADEGELTEVPVVDAPAGEGVTSANPVVETAVGEGEMSEDPVVEPPAGEGEIIEDPAVEPPAGEEETIEAKGDDFEDVDPASSSYVAAKSSSCLIFVASITLGFMLLQL